MKHGVNTWVMNTPIGALMNKHTHRRMRNLIRQHVQAQIDLSWAGTKDPADRMLIEARAKEAKQNLYAYMILQVTN